MKIQVALASMLLLGTVASAEIDITKGFYAGANNHRRKAQSERYG